MDIKRYELAFCEETMGFDMMPHDLGHYVLYDDIKHLLTRPDMAEVERLVDEFERNIKAFFCPKYLSNSEGQLAIKKMNESRTALLLLMGVE